MTPAYTYIHAMARKYGIPVNPNINLGKTWASYEIKLREAFGHRYDDLMKEAARRNLQLGPTAYMRKLNPSFTGKKADFNLTGL